MKKRSSESSNDSYSDEESTKLYEIMSNDRYSDVILVVSDSIKFKSHRNLLGHSSKAFAKIFDNSNEIPVRISVKEFQAEIVKAALEFLYGKSDAIKGKEMEVFKFAEKYDIEELKYC
uniref:BTB domain-containing protein n=1 Tax=Panagrolaimus davidi TaxID=227884 RepID=A0A914R554_9BILA